MEVHKKYAEPWRVTLVDTGVNTMTGGRLKRVHDYIKNDEAFCFTYGDGLSDIDISATLKFHSSHGRLATITAVQPPGRYGALELENENVTGFSEKPMGDGAFINGGFFVLSPECIDFISSDDTVWEREPLESLVEANQLAAYKHNGFWQPMDTLREKKLLDELWKSKKAPWGCWK
jgi:glucose-1-phosphate cytidylyltransferase